MGQDNEFIPNSKWKPFTSMTFVDYEFTVEGRNIIFDERVMPQQLDVKEGDRFIVRLNEYGRVSLVKENNPNTTASD